MLQPLLGFNTDAVRLYKGIARVTINNEKYEEQQT